MKLVCRDNVEQGEKRGPGEGRTKKKRKKKIKQTKRSCVISNDSVCFFFSLSLALEMVLTRGDAGTLNENGWAFSSAEHSVGIIFFPVFDSRL